MAQWWRIHLPIQETWVWSLGWEDYQEEGMATHSSILAWKIPWTEEPSGVQSMGSQRVPCNWSDWEHMHAWIKLFIQTTQHMVTAQLIVNYITSSDPHFLKFCIDLRWSVDLFFWNINSIDLTQVGLCPSCFWPEGLCLFEWLLLIYGPHPSCINWADLTLKVL